MNYFITVDDLDASQNLIKDIKCFFDAEDFTTGFALKGEEITHVAVFHD